MPPGADGWALKSTGCSSGRDRMNSQHQHGSPEASVTSVLRDLMPSLDFSRNPVRMRMHAYKSPAYTNYKSIFNKLEKHVQAGQLHIICIFLQWRNTQNFQCENAYVSASVARAGGQTQGQGLRGMFPGSWPLIQGIEIKPPASQLQEQQ